MKPQILFIDMDGTIAEWRTSMPYEKLFERNYFRSLNGYKNVIQAIKRLHETGIQIFVLSSYFENSPYALREKNLWLDEHAPFLKNRIFCTTQRQKNDVVQEYFGEFGSSFILLDDYSKNLHAWSANGGTSVKLLNGINGTKGTWHGLYVSRFSTTSQIIHTLETILKRNPGYV